MFVKDNKIVAYPSAQDCNLPEKRHFFVCPMNFTLTFRLISKSVRISWVKKINTIIPATYIASKPPEGTFYFFQGKISESHYTN